MRSILITLSFLCAAPARAQLFGEKPDYNNPALYLTPGPQSGISMPAAVLRAEIGVSTSADGVYYAHHYPLGYIFEKPETKTLKFSTLKEVNDYLASLN